MKISNCPLEAKSIRTILGLVLILISAQLSFAYEVHDNDGNSVNPSSLKATYNIAFWDGDKYVESIIFMDDCLYFNWGDGIMDHREFFPKSTTYKRDGNIVTLSSYGDVLKITFHTDPRTKYKSYTLSYNKESKSMSNLLSPVTMTESQIEGVVFFNKKGDLLGIEEEGSTPILLDVLDAFGKKCSK